MTAMQLLLVAAGVLVVCWLTTCVRSVRRGEWMVVTRRGLVVRECRSRLGWRLPFVERFEQDLDRPHELPVGVRATTRDGVPVHVLVEATVSIPRPAPGTRYADPWPAAELAAEETIARSVTGWSAGDLTQTAEASQRPLHRAVRTVVDELGVDVLDLELVEVGVRLDEAARGPE